MRAGKLKDKVTFKRYMSVSDGQGGVIEKMAVLFETYCELQMMKGKEQISGGRMNASAAGVLHLRYCNEATSLTEKDIALIDEQTYNIRSIIDPDRRKQRLELVVERGVPA